MAENESTKAADQPAGQQHPKGGQAQARGVAAASPRQSDDGPADKVAGTREIGGQATVTDDAAEMTATRKASIEAGKAAMEKKRRTAPAIPSAAELEEFREQQFGGKGGTVRIDAQPARRRQEAGPTRLIFFDADGAKVGEREYYGPEPDEG